MKTIDDTIRNIKIRNKVGIKLKNAYIKKDYLTYSHCAMEYAKLGVNMFNEYNFLIEIYNKR